MYVEVVVETPVNLTKKQQELLREFDGAGKGGGHSPDRADALVWAVTHLLPAPRAGPRVRAL